MNERNSYIDFCRAIAVLDVLAGHTAFWVLFWETPNFLKSLTLLFEVPTFFFLSGWASSLRTPDVKKSLYGLTRFFMQWVYFVTVMAAVCAISTHTRFPIQGVAGAADLIENYFFTVSFPGLSIVSISLWWVLAFFIVIPVCTAVLTLFHRSHHAAVYEVIFTALVGIIFLVWSWLTVEVGSGSVYTSPVVTPDEGLKQLLVMGSAESGVTIPFLGFFWLLGYNRKKIKLDRWWKLLIAEAFVIAAYIGSVICYGIAWDDIQTAKFPPAAPYMFSSLILIFLMLYLEPYVKKTGRLLPHIGKNAPFYFFAQGVTSSLCTHIKAYIPGATYVTEKLINGESFDGRYDLVPYFILLIINIAMAIVLAEALAFSYGLIKKMVLKQPLRMEWPIPIIIMLFLFVAVFYETVNAPGPFGEWDDYTFPIVSILRDHRISMTAEDFSSVKEWLYPEWGWMVDGSHLSGMFTADGGELPWYFPVYALCSMPLVLIFKSLSISAYYAFPFTNIILILAALLIESMCLKADVKKRTLITLLLAVHPMIFYISNISGECLIYALFVIACTFWYNRWYKRAALAISIAGMMNPTIMVIGIVMILEYLEREGYYSELRYNLTSGKKWMGLISYGVCFVPSLIPMVYNYYHTGHINLTAATAELVTGNESTFQRMRAYLTDLNYGMFPYFPVLFAVAIVMLLVVLLRIKNVFSYAMPHRYSERRQLMGNEAKERAKAGTRYMEWMITFIVNLALVSTVTHINSGMCAIARYNVWLSVIPIFAIVLFGYEAMSKEAVKKTITVFITAGAVLTGTIVYAYYPHFAMNVQYTDFSPVAEYVLENAPGLYNPIPSTFVARTGHIDGGYEYETPVVYYGSDGYVRKILATKKDADLLVKNYRSATNNMEWFNPNFFEGQAGWLSDRPKYISVPGRYRVKIRE